MTRAILKHSYFCNVQQRYCHKNVSSHAQRARLTHLFWQCHILYQATGLSVSDGAHTHQRKLFIAWLTMFTCHGISQRWFPPYSCEVPWFLLIFFYLISCLLPACCLHIASLLIFVTAFYTWATM